MPHRFDDEGNLLPIPPTPLQAAEAQVKALTAALFQAQEAAKALAQRQWVSLTDEEMHSCWDSPLTPLGMKHARMIEAKLKEKNT